MTCPKCQQELKEVLVTPAGNCITFMCENKQCKVYNQELYLCGLNLLLTRQEFMARKKEEG